MRKWKHVSEESLDRQIQWAVSVGSLALKTIQLVSLTVCSNKQSGMQIF